MEAEDLAWKGMKGIGKGLKAGASGALKVAEKTSMAVLEANDKINDLQYSGAKGPKKPTTQLDSDARAAMKERAQAAQAAKAAPVEDLRPDQSGDTFLGDLKAKAKSTTTAVAAKTKETAEVATSKTKEVTGATLKLATGGDNTTAARERAAGAGHELQFDEDGNPIMPNAPSKGIVGAAGGLVGGVVGTAGGLVGTAVGTTMAVGQKTKGAVVGDDKEAARKRAAGGGQQLQLDENGNPILPTGKSSSGGGLGAMAGGLAGGVGGLAGKAKAKAGAAAAQAKKIVPGAEEGVPPVAPEPEVEPEKAREIVRNNKWAKKPS